MKKIGYIDYYIDEWHATTYVPMIRNASGAKFDVAMAWAKTSPEGKKPLSEWCREHGVREASSLEQVVQQCDCLMVLSPDHPELHEELADLALKSGKPVYIDKSLAPSLAAAVRLFGKAKAHGTPLMSCSALRYAQPLQSAIQSSMQGEKVHFAGTTGGGKFPNYAIHQLEMLVMTLGTGAMRILHFNNKFSVVMLIDYEDGRHGTLILSENLPFQISVKYGQDRVWIANELGDFFPRFIDGVLAFFETGRSPIPEEQTLEIIALLDSGLQALEKPEQWIPVPVRPTQEHY